MLGSWLAVAVLLTLAGVLSAVAHAFLLRPRVARDRAAYDQYFTALRGGGPPQPAPVRSLSALPLSALAGLIIAALAADRPDRPDPDATRKAVGR